MEQDRGQKSSARPVAGKTGTSSDYSDAWFIGYSPSLLAAVWVGYDDKTSLGKNETGARAALPIWISFMESALRDTPAEKFKVPQGITMVRLILKPAFLPAEMERTPSGRRFRREISLFLLKKQVPKRTEPSSGDSTEEFSRRQRRMAHNGP